MLMSIYLALYITHRDFHFAMDGKLAGILERHDGLCHLNGTSGESGYYTHSEVQDYPSISQVSRATLVNRSTDQLNSSTDQFVKSPNSSLLSQISSVAQQNSFLLIFAVIPRYESIWQVRYINISRGLPRSFDHEWCHSICYDHNDQMVITSWKTPSMTRLTRSSPHDLTRTALPECRPCRASCRAPPSRSSRRTPRTLSS